ncbi:MAG: MlaA family lipoprotein [Desulfobacterales bacterium]
MVFDPLSGYNRFMTIVNDHFYVLLFRPLAALYRFVVWEPVAGWLTGPLPMRHIPSGWLIICCNLNSGAWVETGRFFVNTTMGVRGAF